MNIKLASSVAGVLLVWGFITSVPAADIVVVDIKKVSVDDVYDMVKSLAELDRKKLIEKNIGISKEQSEKFWPIYSAYRKDVNKVQKKQFSLIKNFADNYNNLKEEKAAELLDAYVKTKRDILNVRKKYLSDFRKSVSGKKLAKFFQVENKLNAIVEVQLAQAIPLVK